MWALYLFLRVKKKHSCVGCNSYLSPLASRLWRDRHSPKGEGSLIRDKMLIPIENQIWKKLLQLFTSWSLLPFCNCDLRFATILLFIGVAAATVWREHGMLIWWSYIFYCSFLPLQKRTKKGAPNSMTARIRETAMFGFSTTVASTFVMLLLRFRRNILLSIILALWLK